jgi:TRAP-type C4-dicarboxylate transport system permease small subunit
MTDPAQQISLVARIAAFYTRAVESAAIVAMVMLVTVAAYQVFCRYVLNASLFWSEELMRYLMIWTTFLTAGIVYTRGGFLGMRALMDAAPTRLRLAADTVGRLAILTFLLVVAWYGFEFAIRTAPSQAVALQFSMFWVHVSVPVGCVLMTLHVIAEFFLPPDRDRHGHLPPVVS